MDKENQEKEADKKVKNINRLLVNIRHIGYKYIFNDSF